MAVSRYRDRHSMAGKKSDAGNAFVLANILRTDLAEHRPMPADTELAQAIAVLARAQQDAVWARSCAHNKLRSLLREYYPGILAAFVDKRDGLLRAEARAVLAAAPTPPGGGPAHHDPIACCARSRRRQRGLDAEAARIQAILRREYLHQLPLVEDAFARQALALLRQLDTACGNAEDLATATTALFRSHPDAAIITRQPGLGELTGARLLAKMGDDRARFHDARSLKAYAGSAPVTRASGKSRSVTHRRIKNQRLAATGYIWAFATLTASPGARAHYDPAEAPETSTSPPNATCSTASSPACTTAWLPAGTTTKPSPSPPTNRPQLDNLTAWDVFTPEHGNLGKESADGCDGRTRSLA